MNVITGSLNLLLTAPGLTHAHAMPGLIADIDHPTSITSDIDGGAIAFYLDLNAIVKVRSRTHRSWLPDRSR